MGSNLFINYSLAGLNFSYRVFGMRLTNKVVQSTSGEIFTGGVTIDDIKNDSKRLAERNINTQLIACNNMFHYKKVHLRRHTS